MRIGSISNTNFGLINSENMNTLYKIAEEIIAQRGQNEFMAWRKIKRGIEGSFSNSYQLDARIVYPSIWAITLNRPSGPQANILFLKTDDILDRKKLLEIRKELIKERNIKKNRLPSLSKKVK